jgi:hypothetical protein
VIAYEIPPEDADLWQCGVVLSEQRVIDTHLHNMAAMTSDPSDTRTVDTGAQRARRLRRSDNARAIGRVNWIKYLLGRTWAEPRYGDSWPAERIAAFRKRHGEEEYARCYYEATKS